MPLRHSKDQKTGGWSTPALLLLLAAVACQSMAAQQSPAQPGKVRQQLNAPAKTKPAAPPTTAPAAPANADDAGGPQLKTIAMRQSTTRRDPFSALVGGKDTVGGIPDHLPPGKAGLVISTLRVDGIVSGPNGMIAIVSNSQQRVYFLHEGDRLYDGQVGSITLQGVSFHQTGKDPFGRVVQREVYKRLYPTSGEPQ